MFDKKGNSEQLIDWEVKFTFLMSVFNEGNHFLGKPIIGIVVINNSNIESLLLSKVDMILSNHSYLHLLAV